MMGVGKSGRDISEYDHESTVPAKKRVRPEFQMAVAFLWT